MGEIVIPAKFNAHKNYKKMMFLNGYRNVGGGGLLLDNNPEPAAAYSLRKLRTAYDGYAMRVRRSSDLATLDIGFIDNELDTYALLNFVGANNDGTVTIFYDQSLNTNNGSIIISNSTQYAIVVENGDLILNNALPAIKVDTAFYKLEKAITTVTTYSVHRSLSFAKSLYVLLGDSTGGGGLFAGGFFNSINGIGISDGNNPTIYSNVENLETHLTTAVWDVSGKIKVDGVSTPAVMNPIVINNLLLRNQGGWRYDGLLQEMIIYDTLYPQNETDIESNINSHYNIY